jgi:tetratricopeptide (TPR) repeat protein
MALSLHAARLEIGDESGAERALELGFRAHPASATLRDRLEGIYRRKGEWRKLAELCALDANARTDVGERVARLREAAAIWRMRLDDARSAAAVLRLARDAAPGDVTLLGDHVDMLADAGDRASAIAELDAAVALLAEGDVGRAPLLATRANLRAGAGDHGGALADLEQAFSLDDTGFAAALAHQLDRARTIAVESGDTAQVRAIRLRQAHVLPYAGDRETARGILIELVKQDTRDVEALRALADMEAQLEHWDAASAVLRRLVGLEDGARAVATSLRLADACARAGRPGDARGALERARIVAPENRAVRERLESLYEQTAAWRELANLALEDARASGDVAERFARLLRAGLLLLERAGEPAAALAPLEEARALRPADPECVALLADALTLAGRAQEAGVVLDQVIAPYKGKRTRELAPLYWRVARVARHMGDSQGELRAMAYALDCDSQNGAVCADVALRTMELGQLDVANRALRAVTLLKGSGPMSKALAYQYMGEIAKRQQDPKRALVLLKRALMEDPTLEGARALVDAMERGL